MFPAFVVDFCAQKLTSFKSSILPLNEDENKFSLPHDVAEKSPLQIPRVLPMAIA